MGASKALAEFAVEAAQDRWPNTRYAIVRFGNVLGSSGSVVPIFRRQIALGGPLTVTDQRMTRYFMTIPEAVQLVIRAGSLGDRRRDLRAGDGRAGLDLAARRDDDRAVGPASRARTSRSRRSAAGRARSSHEELFNPYERTQPTPAEKILRAEREPLDARTVETMFDEVGLLVLEGDAAALAAKVSELSELRGSRSRPTRRRPARATAVL